MQDYWNLYLAWKQQQLQAGPLIIGTFEKQATGKGLVWSTNRNGGRAGNNFLNDLQNKGDKGKGGIQKEVLFGYWEP